MIIITQDNGMILFTENLINIYGTKIKNEKNKIEYWIVCTDTKGNSWKLGKYTQKRSGEILQEILDNLLKYVTIQNKKEEITNITTIPIAYKLPEK